LSLCSESNAKRKRVARNSKWFFVIKIKEIPVDIFGRTLTASQKITNVSGVSLGYVNNNF